MCVNPPQGVHRLPDQPAAGADGGVEAGGQHPGQGPCQRWALERACMLTKTHRFHQFTALTYFISIQTYRVYCVGLTTAYMYSQYIYLQVICLRFIVSLTVILSIFSNTHSSEKEMHYATEKSCIRNYKLSSSSTLQHTFITFSSL